MTIVDDNAVLLKVGDAGERSFGAWLAHAAGEETSLHAAARQFPSFPDHGDQPQGQTFAPSHLFSALLFNVM